MKDGLAVVAEDIDFLWRDAETFAGGQGGFGIDLAEAEIELAQIAGRNGRLFGDAEDFFTDLRWEIDARVMQEFRVEGWRGAGDFCQRDVDTVGGCAGH